jgi:hypothetical protein
VLHLKPEGLRAWIASDRALRVGAVSFFFNPAFCPCEVRRRIEACSLLLKDDVEHSKTKVRDLVAETDGTGFILLAKRGSFGFKVVCEKE